MYFRRQIFAGFAAVVFVCVFASGTFAVALPVTASWAQHKITSGKFPIRSACMMPSQGQLTHIGMKGAAGMSEESGRWAGALEDMVEAHLKSDEISISSAVNPLASGASDEEVRGVVSQIQQKYASVLPLVRKKPGAIKKSAYTLGDQVGMLPCSENSDVLIFVQGVGQVVTGGRQTMSFLVGGPAEDAVLYVTMADAKTGEILGFTQVYLGDGSLLKPEEAFGQKLSEQLVDMNVGSARKHDAGH